MKTEQLKQLEETLKNYQLPQEVQLNFSTLLEIIHQQSQEILLLKEEIRRLKNLPKNPFLPPQKLPHKKHPLHPKSDRHSKPQLPSPPSSEVQLEELPPDEVHELFPSSTDCPHCHIPLHQHSSQSKTIQELLIRPYLIRFHLHSKRCPQCLYFESAKPSLEYQQSSFGPELRTLISILHYEHRMTEPQIFKFLKSSSIQISSGEVNRILMNNGLLLEEMKEYILGEGTKHSKSVGIDDTLWKTKKVGKHLWTVCNKIFSYFHIDEKRNSEVVEQLIKPQENPHLGITSDDHSCFDKAEIKKKQLCWIHEGRHYEKLSPFVKSNQEVLEKKLTEFWKYYKKIQRYRKKPTQEKKAKLEAEFEKIFTEKTSYEELNKRLELTYKKRERLLLCLTYPELEPHNNEPERTLRHPVKIRNTSIGSRSIEGEVALTSHLTFFETCKKLGRNLKEAFIGFLKQPSLPHLHFQFSSSPQQS
jgi:hypothetical protein